MTIGSGRKIGNIGGKPSKGWVGKTDGFSGDSLGPGANVGGARSRYELQYPSTTSTSMTSTTSSTSSTTTTTTTTA